MSRKLGVGLLISCGLMLSVLFGLRLAHRVERGRLPFHPPPHATTTDVTLIREWMTIPYIAHTYGLPDQALFDALQIPKEDNRRKNLEEINKKYFPTQDGFVLDRVQQAILAFQQGAPLPPLPSAPVNLPVPPSP